jgi:hypothetical protein
MGVSYNTAVVTNGLLMYLDAANKKSYAGSGATWTDLTGNGYNASLINSPVYSPSINLGAFTFDGATNYAQYSIPYPFAMTITTIAKSANSTWNTYGTLGSGRFQNGYIIHPNQSATTVDFYLFDGAATYIGLGSVTPTNIQNPNVYTISTNGSNLHKVYLNGILQITNTTAIIRSATPSANIGAVGYDYGIAGRILSGNIFSHSIYNRQLSDLEVLQNCNATRGRFGL